MASWLQSLQSRSDLSSQLTVSAAAYLTLLNASHMVFVTRSCARWFILRKRLSMEVSSAKITAPCSCLVIFDYIILRPLPLSSSASPHLSLKHGFYRIAKPWKPFSRNCGSICSFIHPAVKLFWKTVLCCRRKSDSVLNSRTIYWLRIIYPVILRWHLNSAVSFDDKKYHH